MKTATPPCAAGQHNRPASRFLHEPVFSPDPDGAAGRKNMQQLILLRWLAG